MAERSERSERAAKPTMVNVTIAADSDVSSAANLAAGGVAMILMPVSTQWTSANIGFRVSNDNVNFYDLADETGAIILKTVTPGTAVMMDPSFTQPVLWLKIRSTIVQSQDCVFTLAVQ
jgi:hypothetical protein